VTNIFYHMRIELTAQIGICVILGSTYTGEYEDAKAVNDLLIKKNIDTVIHIDAASGGFVAPFVNPGLEWDFRLEKVVSINTSGHKYGLVRPLRKLL
jgi:glutamate decarboxylase